jgi:hypothetical protein
MKQFDYLMYSVGLNQRKKQMLELQFSKWRLFYSKSGIFGVSGSFKFQHNLEILKPYPRGGQIKSSKLTKEHRQSLLVNGDYLSSSEDG